MTKSNCCSATIRMAHGCDNDSGHSPCNCLKSGGVTCWDECVACGKPCDIKDALKEFTERMEFLDNLTPSFHTCNKDLEGKKCKTCEPESIEMKYKNPLPENPEEVVGDDFFEVKQKDSWEEEFEYKFKEMLDHIEACLGVSERENLKSFLRQVEKEAYERGKNEAIESLKFLLP